MAKNKITNALKSIFSKPQPVSGGNSFEVYTKQLAQVELNNSTIPSDLNNMNQSINDKFLGQNYSQYQLMLFQANYFCNRKVYIAKDNEALTLVVKHIIRHAFFSGASAFYLDPLGSYRILQISKIDYKLNGEIEAIYGTYSSLSYDFSTNELIEPDIVLKDEQIEKVAIFYWNDMRIGAWYWLLPFLKQQESLLKIVSATRYSYLKKFNYQIKNSAFVRDEIDLYFNENNPFLSNLSEKGEHTTNRFEQIQLGNADIDNLKTYYTLFMEIYYKMFGRRVNDDNKQERNIAGEVEASQSNYDVLEKETFFYLTLFIKKVEQITGIDIEELKSLNEQIKEKEVVDIQEVGVKEDDI